MLGALVVVARCANGQARPVGIFTDRGMLRAEMRCAADVFSVRVAGARTLAPLVLEQSVALAEGIARPGRKGVRLAPVADARGNRIHLNLLDDLLVTVAAALSERAELIGRQTRREYRSACSDNRRSDRADCHPGRRWRIGIDVGDVPAARVRRCP